MSVLGGITLASVFGMAVLLADDQRRPTPPDEEKITLQYRVKLDAVVPSGFVALHDKGMTLRLKITWDISAAKKEELDALIKKLEDMQINGVEFECKGQWIIKGTELRVTTMPKVTEKGKKLIDQAKP